MNPWTPQTALKDIVLNQSGQETILNCIAEGVFYACE